MTQHSQFQANVNAGVINLSQKQRRKVGTACQVTPKENGAVPILFMCNVIRLTQHGKTETYLFFFQILGFFIICFVNGSFINCTLLYTKRKEKFRGFVIYRLFCNGFTGLAHSRSNWAVCGPRTKVSVTPLL